jgi:hypothetical protein
MNGLEVKTLEEFCVVENLLSVDKKVWSIAIII